jgi:hypothetical protein
LKRYFAGLLLVSLLSLPVPAVACSLAGCIGNGVETRPNFVVVVTHDGKPLVGVTIQVTAFGDGKATEHFSAITGRDGTAPVAGLRPGAYWLNSDLLGVSAGSQCFHVGVHSSWTAKRKLKYAWGDLAPATQQIAGKLIDSQPGHGESPIMNFIHRVDIPIVGARMKLQDPLTGNIYSAVSDDNGYFTFDSAQKGIYVLHIDSGTISKDRDYDSTDLLIRLSDTAKRQSLLLERREAGGGSCGGTYLELQGTPN